MSKSITFKEVPDEIVSKYEEFKDIISEHGLTVKVYGPIILENALDIFLNNPDVKTLIK